MHSSRMRTARSSGRPGEGLRQHPPLPEQTPLPSGADLSLLLTESQTPVKTLPCPNFVAGGD